MSETLLVLPEGSTQTLSGRKLEDLLDYSEPGWILVHDDPSPRQRRWLKQRTTPPVLFSGDSGWHVINNQPFLTLNAAEEIPDETGPSTENLCVISTFIEEDVDPHSFSVTWNGLDTYGEFSGNLDGRTNHLAVNQPVGRRIQPDGTELTIHGAGSEPDRTQFSALNIGSSVFLEETLAHSNLGLQAIKGIGREKAHTFRQAGFETRRTLQEQDPADLLSLGGIGPYYACVAVAGARAHETDTPLWFSDNPLRDRDRVYVDIETDSTRVSNIWLIGVYDESEDDYRSFIQTDDPVDAATVPSQFARWVHENAADKTFVTWFGRQFDFVWLDRFVQKHADKDHVRSWLQTDRVDLLMDVVRSRLCLPVRSHKLDVVARRLGYDRTHEGIDGGDAAAAYARWCEDEEPDWDRWVAYCRDDVMGMKHVYDRIRSAPRELNIDSVRNTYHTASTAT